MRRVRATIVAVKKHYYILCVCLFIQYAMRMRHVVSCGLSGCTIFFPHYFIKGTINKKKRYGAQNICFDFLYKFV
jgi:hypothetical protein